MTTHHAMLDALVALHNARELCVGAGATIQRHRNYLSGLPYLWSSDVTRAFVFASRATAEAFIGLYPKELRGATAQACAKETA